MWLKLDSTGKIQPSKAGIWTQDHLEKLRYPTLEIDMSNWKFEIDT